MCIRRSSIKSCDARGNMQQPLTAQGTIAFVQDWSIDLETSLDHSASVHAPSRLSIPSLHSFRTLLACTHTITSIDSKFGLLSYSSSVHTHPHITVQPPSIDFKFGLCRHIINYQVPKSPHSNVRASPILNRKTTTYLSIYLSIDLSIYLSIYLSNQNWRVGESQCYLFYRKPGIHLLIKK